MPLYVNLIAIYNYAATDRHFKTVKRVVDIHFPITLYVNKGYYFITINSAMILRYNSMLSC